MSDTRKNCPIRLEIGVAPDLGLESVDLVNVPEATAQPIRVVQWEPPDLSLEAGLIVSMPERRAVDGFKMTLWLNASQLGLVRGLTSRLRLNRLQREEVGPPLEDRLAIALAYAEAALDGKADGRAALALVRDALVAYHSR